MIPSRARGIRRPAFAFLQPLTFLRAALSASASDWLESLGSLSLNAAEACCLQLACDCGNCQSVAFLNVSALLDKVLWDQAAVGRIELPPLTLPPVCLLIANAGL